MFCPSKMQTNEWLRPNLQLKRRMSEFSTKSHFTAEYFDQGLHMRSLWNLHVISLLFILLSWISVLARRGKEGRGRVRRQRGKGPPINEVRTYDWVACSKKRFSMEGCVNLVLSISSKCGQGVKALKNVAGVIYGRLPTPRRFSQWIMMTFLLPSEGKGEKSIARD